MEFKETMRTRNNVTEIENNYKKVLEVINNEIDSNKYVVVVNGKKVNNIDVPFNVGALNSLNSRKGFAKRLWNVYRKPSLRNINMLFFIAKRQICIKDSVSVKPSLKEQRIIKARKECRKLQKEYEQAQLRYKEEKGDFFIEIA